MSNEQIDRTWMILCAAVRDGMMMPSTAIKRLIKLGYTKDEAMIEVAGMKNGSVDRIVTPRCLKPTVKRPRKALVAVKVTEDLEVIEIFDFYDETYSSERSTVVNG